MFPVWEGKAPPAGAPASTAFSAARASSKFKVGRSHAVITASRADERSWEGRPFDNGYFTHFLPIGLRQGNGMRPLIAVFRAVRDQVSHAVSHEHPGYTQTPTFEFSEQADTIVLGAPESAGKQN